MYVTLLKYSTCELTIFVMCYVSGSLPGGQVAVYQPQPFMQPVVCLTLGLSYDEVKNEIYRCIVQYTPIHATFENE